MWCTARSGIFDFISFPFLLFEFKACQRQCIFLRFWRTLYRAHSATDDASDKMTKEDFFFSSSSFSFFFLSRDLFLFWTSLVEWQTALTSGRWRPFSPPYLYLFWLLFSLLEIFIFICPDDGRRRNPLEKEKKEMMTSHSVRLLVYLMSSPGPPASLWCWFHLCVCERGTRTHRNAQRERDGATDNYWGGGEKKFPCTESFQPLLRHYRKKKKKKKLSSVSCNFIIEWVFFFCCSVVCEGSGAKSVGSDHRDRSSSSSSSGLDFADRYLADWNVD